VKEVKEVNPTRPFGPPSPVKGRVLRPEVALAA